MTVPRRLFFKSIVELVRFVCDVCESMEMNGQNDTYPADTTAPQASWYLAGFETCVSGSRSEASTHCGGCDNANKESNEVVEHRKVRTEHGRQGTGSNLEGEFTLTAESGVFQ